MGSLHTAFIFYSLLFIGAGFAIGLLHNNRKVVRLEDKVLRLKRTVRHLQHQLDESPRPAASEPRREPETEVCQKA